MIKIKLEILTCKKINQTLKETLKIKTKKVRANLFPILNSSAIKKFPKNS
jgi:hypothetical protein